MRVCLFEDRAAADLEPLSLTRPTFDLLCGLTPLFAKHYRCFGASDVCLLVRPHLADSVRERSPGVAVNDAAWLREGPAVLVNGRWLPPPGELSLGDPPYVAVVEDEVAFAVLDARRIAQCPPEAIDYCLSAWKAALPQRPAGGRMLRHLWDLVALNGDQIGLDYEQEAFRRLTPPPVMPTLVGPSNRLAIDPSARLEPHVVAVTTAGPVVIAADAVVTAFTRLEGPCVVGPGTHVLGAKIRAGTTLGPNCRIGGEVEASIVQGFSNKYHDGFLGHSYLGEWVNLGAGTQTSDLRLDYGEVMVTVQGHNVPTGQNKVGCFLGDHTRTAIGTLLNTGTSVGVFCNLLPGGLLPRHVPSFVNLWHGRLTDGGDVDQLLETAALAMDRRGRRLGEALATLYRTLHEETTAERVCAVREAETRVLRRSA